MRANQAALCDRQAGGGEVPTLCAAIDNGAPRLARSSAGVRLGLDRFRSNDCDALAAATSRKRVSSTIVT